MDAVISAVPSPVAPQPSDAEITGAQSSPASLGLLRCNLCGSPSYTILFEAGVAQINRIVKCNDCELLYANPRLSGADVDQIKTYDPEWVLEHATTTYQWRIAKEALQVRDYRSTRKVLAQQFPRRGRLIEIGCGMGYLLNYFREDGWDTLGVEPNGGLCAYARRQFGLKTIANTIDEARLESNSVDVVTMFHVIEHVPDPMAVFSEVYRILAPRGYMVVETPRYDTLMFWLLGRRERSVSCDGHIYFFTTNTLQRMATAAGFQVVRSDCVGRSMTLDRLLYNVGVVSKSAVIASLLQKSSTAFGLERLALKLNLRDMQRLYLRKP
jgi:SAM-dependent methyltransferase